MSWVSVALYIVCLAVTAALGVALSKSSEKTLRSPVGRAAKVLFGVALVIAVLGQCVARPSGEII